MRRSTSRLGRPIQVLRNLAIAASFTKDHVVDDPMVLLVQASQVLPQSLVHPVAGALQRVRPEATSTVGALAAAVRGDHTDLARRVRSAVSGAAAPRSLARLADIALAVHDGDLADEAFAGIEDPERSGRTVQAVAARMAAYDGDMTGAARWAHRFGATSHVARRFDGRLDMLSGRAVNVPPQPAYVPEPGRILHVLTNSLPHSPSGYPQRTHSILLALQEKGWDVRAVTRIAYPVQVGRLLADNRDVLDGIVYDRLLPWRVRRDDFSARMQQAEEMVPLIRQFSPAILHTTTPFHNSLPVRALARAFDIPWIYEVRGQQADTWLAKHGERATDSEYYRLFRDREIEAALTCDAVVTIGESMRQTLLAAGVEDAKITLCPNAVGEAFLEEPLSPQEARERLGLDTDLDYVGAVSSLVGYEGHDDLLEAFALLTDRFPRLRLLLVGDGVRAGALRNQARELGITDRCVFPGRVPRSEAVLWHQAQDVFIVPRKDREVTRAVTPMKPVEASASARPVIASDLPALAELVRDEDNGLLVEPENPTALAAAITRLVEDADLRTRLGRAGREWALRERTWAANADRYTAVYESLGAVRD